MLLRCSVRKFIFWFTERCELFSFLLTYLSNTRVEYFLHISFIWILEFFSWKSTVPYAVLLVGESPEVTDCSRPKLLREYTRICIQGRKLRPTHGYRYVYSAVSYEVRFTKFVDPEGNTLLSCNQASFKDVTSLTDLESRDKTQVQRLQEWGGFAGQTPSLDIRTGETKILRMSQAIIKDKGQSER